MEEASPIEGRGLCDEVGLARQVGLTRLLCSTKVNVASVAVFSDFNVWSERKRIEKLRYMHWNPVKRGLMLEPEQWEWSSYRGYAYQEEGRVKINQWPKVVMKVRAVA